MVFGDSVFGVRPGPPPPRHGAKVARSPRPAENRKPNTEYQGAALPRRSFWRLIETTGWAAALFGIGWLAAWVAGCLLAGLGALD